MHKIQSGKGSLHIEMDQVPKILKPLVAEWTRESYIVSFKVSSLPFSMCFPFSPPTFPASPNLQLFNAVRSSSSRRTRTCSSRRRAMRSRGTATRS